MTITEKVADPDGAIDEPPEKVASAEVFDEFQPPALAAVTVKLVLGLEILTQRMVWEEVLLTLKPKELLLEVLTLVGETLAVHEETAAFVDSGR